MSETVVTSVIHIILLVITAWAFFYARNKDKKEATKQFDTKIHFIESRIELLTIKNNDVSSQLIEYIRITTMMQESLTKINLQLTQLTMEIKHLQNIRETLVSFDNMLRGVSRVVAEHGIKIENTTKNIDNHLSKG